MKNYNYVTMHCEFIFQMLYMQMFEPQCWNKSFFVYRIMDNTRWKLPGRLSSWLLALN